MPRAARFATLALFLSAASAPAADYFWDTSLVTGNWTTQARWSTSGAGGPFTSTWADGNTANFSAGQIASITIGTPVTAAGISITGGINMGVTGSGSLTLTGAVDVAASNIAQFSVNIDGGLTKTGAGFMNTTTANTYTGATVINGGTFSVGNNTTTGSIANTSGVSVAAGATFQYNRSDAASFARDISGAGTFQKSGAGTLTLTGTNTYSGATNVFSGTLQVGDGGTAGAIGNTSGVTLFSGTTLAYNRSDAVTLDRTVGGIGGFDKRGAGTLTLTGANSYSGGTTLTAGSLELGSAGAIGTTGTISFNGGTLRYTASNTTDYSSRFSNAAGQQYRIDTNGQTVTLASNLSSDSGSLNKINSGTLILSGSNSFTGGVTITNGRLQLGTANALGSTGAISFAGGTMVFTASNATDYSSRFTSTGTSPYSFDTGGQTVTLASNLTGTGKGLTKGGSGTLILSGTNTYTGATSILNGTVRLEATGALSSASAVSLGGGTLRVASGTTNGSITGGTLTLTANSVIDFANPGATTILAFGDSSGVSWVGGQTLTINGWNGSLTGGGTSQLRVAGLSSLTASQLSQITFSGFGTGAAILSNAGVFEIVPVPEPGAVLALTAAGLGLARVVRRRFRAG